MTECTQCPNGQLHERVGMLERQMARQTAVLENLDRNMGELVQIGKAQVRVETQQLEHGRAINRAFGAIEQLGKTTDNALDKVQADIAELKKDAPKNRIASDWVFRVAEWLVAIVIGGAIVLYFFPA